MNDNWLQQLGNGISNFLTFDRSYSKPQIEQYQDNNGIWRDRILSPSSGSLTLGDIGYYIGDNFSDLASAFGTYLTGKGANAAKNREIDILQQNLDRSIATGNANYVLNGTNLANSANFHAQALSAFNQPEGAKAANNYIASLNQLNEIAKPMGLDKPFTGSIQQLKQYT